MKEKRESGTRAGSFSAGLDGMDEVNKDGDKDSQSHLDK